MPVPWSAVAVPVGHAGGTGWDEVAIIAVPIVVLALLQVLGRRKKSADDEPGPGGRPPPDEEG